MTVNPKGQNKVNGTLQSPENLLSDEKKIQLWKNIQVYISCYLNKCNFILYASEIPHSGQNNDYFSKQSN